jgi:hypothetical protein
MATAALAAPLGAFALSDGMSSASATPAVPAAASVAAAVPATAPAPTNHPMTAAMMTTEANAARAVAASHGHIVPDTDTWQCVNNTEVAVDHTTFVGFTYSDAGVFVVSNSTATLDPWDFCGWKNASVDQFALYYTGTGDYACMVQSGNYPIEIDVCGGGNNAAFFSMACNETDFLAEMDFNFVTNSKPIVTANIGPSYQLYGTTGAYEEFIFNQWPGAATCSN